MRIECVVQPGGLFATNGHENSIAAARRRAIMMAGMNPYQSPGEPGNRPPITLRPVVGMILVALSGVMFAAASFPPVAVLTRRESNTYIILSAFGAMALMSLAAIGTLWLGWRRVSVRRDECHRDESDINRQPSPDAGSQPAGDHADGAAE